MCWCEPTKRIIWCDGCGPYLAEWKNRRAVIADQANKIANANGQIVGENNDLYITLEQLDGLLKIGPVERT